MLFSWGEKSRLAVEMKIFLSISAKVKLMTSPLSTAEAEWPLP